jgi:ribose-phosphate pyrophosphokinase
MHTIIWSGHEQLARDAGLVPLAWTYRHFPDQESYVRITDPVPKQVAILCSLNDLDYKIFPLIMVAQTLKRLGAEHITLIAPYFGYLRQDIEFMPGEAISAHIFGQLISQYIDHVVTIDPHLHRIHSFDEILSIPSTVLHADTLLADYIKKHIVNPLIIGPDGESLQWVQRIAVQLNAPYIIAHKTRTGDRDVAVKIDDLSPYTGCSVVLVDDVISTGQTLYQAAKAVEHPNLTILAVHAVFADDSYNLLRSVSSHIVTTNTIPHDTNGMSIASMLTKSINVSSGL